jgi:hypothetical protein
MIIIGWITGSKCTEKSGPRYISKIFGMDLGCYDIQSRLDGNVE